MERPPRPARASVGPSCPGHRRRRYRRHPRRAAGSEPGRSWRARGPGAAMDHKPLLQERPPAYNLEAGQGDYACGPHGYGAIPTAPPPPPYPYLVTGGPAARRGPRAASCPGAGLLRQRLPGAPVPALPGGRELCVGGFALGFWGAHPQARSAQLEAGRTGARGGRRRAESPGADVRSTPTGIPTSHPRVYNIHSRTVTRYPANSIVVVGGCPVCR